MCGATRTEGDWTLSNVGRTSPFTVGLGLLNFWRHVQGRADRFREGHCTAQQTHVAEEGANAAHPCEQVDADNTPEASINTHVSHQRPPSILM